MTLTPRKEFVDFSGGLYPTTLYAKEFDRRWEEGEDLSLLEFKVIEYKRKGYVVQLTTIPNTREHAQDHGVSCRALGRAYR